ncbi:hypothetical protein ACLKA7_017668 [Drosophila subpalustris]
MPSMLDHIILGMDFLCAMGATVRCGNVKLILETVPLPGTGPTEPAVRAEGGVNSFPSVEGGEPTRRAESPSERAMVEVGTDVEDEPPDEEVEWPAGLEPELQEFLETELALVEGLKGVSESEVLP